MPGKDFRSSVGGLLFTILDTRSDPLAVLAAIRDLRADLDGNERAAVEHALANGRTWQEIAAVLGTADVAGPKQLA
jgi:hypothetical protein